jgi:hypothetical protein
MEDLRNIKSMGDDLTDFIGEEVDFIHNPFDYLKTSYEKKEEVR